MTSHPYLLGTLAALGWLLLIVMVTDALRYQRRLGNWRPDKRRDEDGPL